MAEQEPCTIPVRTGSAAGSFGRLRWSLPFLLNGIVGQALLVGLPSALCARRATDAPPGRAPIRLSLA